MEGPLRPVVDAARRVVAEASGIAARVEQLEAATQRVALEQDNLTPLVGDLDGVRQELARVADLASDAGARHLRERTGDLAALCDDVIEGIEGLPAERLREALADLALRVAIVRLLAQMVARFSVEVTAAGTGATSRGTELRLLQSALARQVEDADAGSARVTELLGVVPELLAVTRSGAQRLAHQGEAWAAELALPATGEALGGAAAEVGALAMAAEADLASAADGLLPLAEGVEALHELGTQVGLGAVRGLVERIGDGVIDVA